MAPLVASGQRPQFTSGVDLVEVYVTIADRGGRPIDGLSAADFEVREDGRPQSISTFAAGTVPLSVAIAIDRSFSMAGKSLDLARDAADAFVDALLPTDQAMVVAIGSEPEIVAPLGSDRETARRAVDRLEPWGTTPLRDAIVAALDAIEPARGRRALVLLSDGADRGSGATPAEVVDHARQSDVLLYPIAIGKSRPPIFAELAAVTGGRSASGVDRAALRATAAGIATELRHQYLLGYVPPSPPSPGWHSIEVTVNRPDARVRARDGYVAR